MLKFGLKGAHRLQFGEGGKGWRYHVLKGTEAQAASSCVHAHDIHVTSPAKSLECPHKKPESFTIYIVRFGEASAVS